MGKRDMLGKGMWSVVYPDNPNISFGSSNPLFYTKNTEPRELLKLLANIVPGEAYRCQWEEWCKVGRKIRCVLTLDVTVTA